jgi:uncharacterized membrane protein/protein-disulfide isomerase
MSSVTRTLLLAFALLGLAAASTAAYVHYRLLTDPTYTSFCDVSGKVNCTQAYLSPYGSVAGVPVAIPGVIFFLLVVCVTVIGGRRRSGIRDAIPAYVFALSALALLAVFYLAWASYVQLQTFCLVCATTYVAVVGLFVVAGRASGFSMATLPRRAMRDTVMLVTSPLALAIVLLLTAGVATILAVFPRESAIAAQEPAYPPLTDQQRADLEKWWSLQPKSDLPIPNDGAKVLIVKFSDYMCPACRQTYEWYKPVLGKYLATGDVRYVVKHFPLEAECNPHAAMNHYASCEAAAAVIMARPKGTAQKLEQWIFANQQTLTSDTVKKAAREIGGIQDFDAQYPRALQEVKLDAGLGGVLKVNSTPTFYINGRKLPNKIMLPQYFDYLIELALKDLK